MIPAELRRRVLARDGGCVGAKLGWSAHQPGTALELDHVIPGGMGKKGPTEEWALVALCSWCHRYRTEHGREARPQLLDYLAQLYPAASPAASEGNGRDRG